jgi:hypothetical protein
MAYWPSWHSPRVTEKKHKHLNQVSWSLGPRFEPEASRTRSRSVNHSTQRSVVSCESYANSLSKIDTPTPWSTAFLENETLTQVIKKFPPFFYRTQSSISCSQKPATVLYPAIGESSSHPHTLFL